MKKKLFAFTAIVAMLLLVSLGGTGFLRVTSVAVTDWSVSEDGTELTLRAENAASMGYIRAVRMHRNGDTAELSFYACFGGPNSSFGAKSEFTVPLREIGRVSVYRGAGYEELLRRNEGGEWVRSAP